MINRVLGKLAEMQFEPGKHIVVIGAMGRPLASPIMDIYGGTMTLVGRDARRDSVINNLIDADLIINCSLKDVDDIITPKYIKSTCSILSVFRVGFDIEQFKDCVYYLGEINEEPLIV